jgi:hypothetical protein
MWQHVDRARLHLAELVEQRPQERAAPAADVEQRRMAAIACK